MLAWKWSTTVFFFSHSPFTDMQALLLGFSPPILLEVFFLYYGCFSPGKQMRSVFLVPLCGVVSFLF